MTPSSAQPEVCAEAVLDEWLEGLLRQQLAEGFPDLRGAEAAITLPVSERLLNDVVARTIPRAVPVSELHVTPQADDRFLLHFRVGSSSFLPRLTIALAIDRQPELPALPILVLRIETTGLMMLAAPVLRLLNALPEGIVVKDDRIHVDLRALADRRGAGSYFEYLNDLRIHTVNGAVVVTVRGGVR